MRNSKYNKKNHYEKADPESLRHKRAVKRRRAQRRKKYRKNGG